MGTEWGGVGASMAVLNEGISNELQREAGSGEEELGETIGAAELPGRTIERERKLPTKCKVRVGGCFGN